MMMELITRELVELERQFWQALKDKDTNAAVRLTDEPCIVTGAQGVESIDHNTFRGMMEGANWVLEDFSFENTTARLLSDDVAIVAYKVKEKLLVDGKPLTLEAADTSTWIRRDGQWRCAMHTEAIAGDPFGRDRVAESSEPKQKGLA